MPMRHLNAMVFLLIMFFTLLILSFTGILEFPSASTSIEHRIDPETKLRDSSDPFRDVTMAFKKWDFQVGCARFWENHKHSIRGNVSSGSLQEFGGSFGCGKLKMEHVKVLVKGWTWIPDNLENLYSCRCGMTCLWTKSSVLVDSPDALLFETTTPPLQAMKFQTWSIAGYLVAKMMLDDLTHVVMISMEEEKHMKPILKRSSSWS